MSDVAGVIERLDSQTFIDQAMRMIEDAAVSGGDLEPMIVNQSDLAGAFSDLLSSLSARIAELERERDVLREDAVEAQVRAYQWMKAHDALQAGTDYSFPSPANVPNLVTRAEAAEAKLAKAEEALKMTDAARDVLAERQRQVEVECWTPAHDDALDNGQLAAAAATYITEDIRNWPWDAEWYRPTDARRNLVKAGALILADIERLDRAALTPKPNKEGE